MSGFALLTQPNRRRIRAAQTLWRALWRVVVCAALLTGPAQARTVILDVKISFEGVFDGPRGTPRWRVEMPPAEIEAQLGVLREGDVVSLSILSSAPRLIGLWLQDDRYFARQQCRTSWFRTRCERIYETQTCRLEHLQDPANGALRLSVVFQPYTGGAGSPHATAVPEPIATLGNGRRDADHEVMGSRRLVLSGAFGTERLVCMRLRGEARGDPVLSDVLGAHLPETFFQLMINVFSPTLED